MLRNIKLNILILLNFSFNSSSFSILVPVAKILAPFSYKFSTIEFPIPPEAPVTIIFLFLNYSLILINFISSSVFIALTLTFLSILFIKPDKTLPGPISIN